MGECRRKGRRGDEGKARRRMGGRCAKFKQAKLTVGEWARALTGVWLAGWLAGSWQEQEGARDVSVPLGPH